MGLLSKKPEHVVFSTVKPNVIQQYYDEVSKVSANTSLHVFLFMTLIKISMDTVIDNVLYCTWRVSGSQLTKYSTKMMFMWDKVGPVMWKQICNKFQFDILIHTSIDILSVTLKKYRY